MPKAAHAKMVRAYLGVFAALTALTALTVGVSYLPMEHTAAIFFAVLIATFKASLIALFFMHLKFETRLIHYILYTALLLLGVLILMVLPDLSYGCAVCFGDSSAQLTQGFYWGTLILLLLPILLLTGLGGLLFFSIRKNRERHSCIP